MACDFDLRWTNLKDRERHGKTSHRGIFPAEVFIELAIVNPLADSEVNQSSDELEGGRGFFSEAAIKLLFHHSFQQDRSTAEAPKPPSNFPKRGPRISWIAIDLSPEMQINKNNHWYG